MNKEENGKFWQLDKDLKVFDNKVYSVDTCIFVPNRVNSILLTCSSARGEYPIGVCWDKQNKKFKSQCADKLVRHLGLFTCTLEAHQAWQRHKIELVPILLAQAQRIEDDLLNNRETNR
jgi:hypothetical protein